MSWHRLLVASAAAVALSASSGCSLGGLAFRNDQRLVIEGPESRSEVEVPFEVSWRLSNPNDNETRFAVLVDRFPPRPSQSIESLLPPELREPARCDDTCRTAALEARNVFVTDEMGIVITRLPVRRGVSEERQRRHEISVIVLDDDLRRVGETVEWVEVDTSGPSS